MIQRFALPILLCFSFACRPSATGMVVELKLELSQPTEEYPNWAATIHGLQLKVSSSNGNERAFVELPPTARNLIALVPNGESDEALLIEAKAVDEAGQVLASRKVHSGFRPHHIVLLPLTLKQHCFGSAARQCAAELTCGDEEPCVEVPFRSPGKLDTYEDNVLNDWAPPDPKPDAATPPVDAPPNLDGDHRPAPCAVAVGEGHLYCDQFATYAWEKIGEEMADKSYLIAGPAFTSAGNSVRFNFEKADQLGSLSMKFTSPRKLIEAQADVVVGGPVSTKLFITLETKGGAAGCFYPIDAVGVIDLTKGYSCWGDSNFVPLSISFRVKSAGPGTVTLTLKRLNMR